MIAVIFRAKVGVQDDEYSSTVSRMRKLALENYGCLEFVSVTESKSEIAISYWECEDAIGRWKSDSEHMIAQELGRKKWYESYTVQIAEIKREYKLDANPSSD